MHSQSRRLARHSTALLAGASVMLAAASAPLAALTPIPCPEPCPPQPYPTDTYSDVRLFGAAPNDLDDDTAEIQAAANAAAGGVLWIPTGVFLLSGTGVSIPSNTTVKGGGTIKNIDGTADRLFRLENVENVRIEDLTFDGNVVTTPPLARNDDCTLVNPPVPNCTTCDPSEHRHQIALYDADEITITGCTFKDQSGDGVYISDLHTNPGDGCSPRVAGTDCSGHVLIQGNRFLGHPVHRSRNGVAATCGEGIQVKDNLFIAQGRYCMPGAIDFEADCSFQDFRNIEASGNQIFGVDFLDPLQCTTRVSNNGIVINADRGGLSENVVFANNTINGCFQTGITVAGAGSLAASAGSLPEKPVIVTGNSIANIGSGRSFVAGIQVVPGPSGNRPSNAILSGNTFDTIRGGFGIFVWNSSVLIDGNDVARADRQALLLDVRNGRQAVVTSNRFIDSAKADGTPYAVRLWGASHLFSSNEIYSSGTPTPVGLSVEGAGSVRNVISGNVFSGTTVSIRADDGPQLLMGNELGTGSLDLAPIGYPPQTGSWQRGAIVYNPGPDVGEPVGWIYTGTGVQNGWNEFGVIAHTAAELNQAYGNTFVTASGATFTGPVRLKAPLEIEGAGGIATTLAAANPAASNTLTLPTVAGTLVASNSPSAQMLCGNVLVDPPSISGGASATVTVAAGIGLATNDACICSPRADWNASVVLKYCSAGPSQLKVQLYSAKTVNAGAQTVDFCCLRK